MRIDTIIDLETLDTKPTCVILSIGACKVNMDTREIVDKFYTVCSIQDQLNNGRTISESTLMWWLKQSDSARKLFRDIGENARYIDASKLEYKLRELSDFVGPGAVVWGNGSSFDISILENAYKYDNPWRPWDIRDMRTIVDVAEINKSEFEFKGTKHHALDDAVFEAEIISAAYQKIKGALNEN